MLSPRRAKKHASGFTLIELLVVIAIIAILAAIAIPAYSGMVQSGKSAKCLSNLRQQGIAVNGYVSENNGLFPADPTGNDTWAKYLGPYIPLSKGDSGNVVDRVFRCPAETKVPPSDFQNSVNHYIATYVFFKGSSQNTGPNRLAAVQNPSQTLLIVDGQLNPQNNSGYNCNTAATYTAYTADCNASNPTNTSSVSFRHKGNSMNAVYVDGHVATIPWNTRTSVTKTNWNGR
ncbi:MAG: type II secretion system protein [Sphaerospermopsis kisseleviana]